MKILFVATDYPERGKPTTGFPNYIKRVSLVLIQMGHKPLIVAAGAKDSYRTEQGIDIWTVGMKYKTYGFQTLNYIFNAAKKGYNLSKKVDEIIEKEAVDIVQYTSLEGIAMFYRGRIPAVLRLSSYAKTYFNSMKTYSPVAVKVMAQMERWSARRCSMIFAPCKITAQSFGRDCRRRVKVIETPFLNDVKEYDDSYYEEYLTNRKYALFFGTLYAEKGIVVIADILERFLQSNLQYYFVFVGNEWSINGEDFVGLLKKKAGSCGDRVIILNALPHEQLYPIIMNSDFVVLPSLMDNLPNACIEAMYFKRIVIGTDGASFEQLITHEKTGLLCKRGDSGDLLEKMQRAVSMSVEEKEKMGNRANQRIDRLKPEFTVKKLIQLYEYVLEKEIKK